MADHNKTGEVGESIAQKYLSAKGYEILETNWRFSRAEIDIIARKDEALIFIEVKSRSSKHFGSPETFVTAKKEDFLKSAAMHYMESVGYEWEFRFDIIAITFSSQQSYEVKHIEDAFY